MAQFFKIPFGTSSFKTTIPDADSASVSWQNGYTAFYEYDPTKEDSGAKHIERDIFNTLLYEITSSLQAVQLNGIAPYYDAVIGSDGPGYNEGSVIYYANKIWRSKVAGNKIRPNETTTANWEEVLGYDSLVNKLKNAGLINSGSSETNESYSKSEIDTMINDIKTALKNNFVKDLGEIYLISQYDSSKNIEGFFICNGDIFPYTDGEPTSSSQFYGNVLYSLCFYSGDGSETDFKTRWNIAIDKEKKTIGLPNIVGYVNESEGYVSDAQNVVLTLGKEAKLIGADLVKDSDLKLFAQSYELSEAIAEGNVVIRTTMVPCIYLGPYDNGEG